MSDSDTKSEWEQLREELTRLQKLAYIGEHHFPDLTYKARLEETVGDLRCTELKLEQSRARQR